MKFTCVRDDILTGVNTVQKAVSDRSTNALLEGILIEAGETRVKLTGNDLEIAIEYEMDAEIAQSGAIVVNSRLFGEIVRKIPDSEEVLIFIDKNNLVVIDCELSHFEMKGLNPEGFPRIPEIEKQKTLMIEQSKLKEMVRQTIFSVCQDEYRPVLTGALFEYEGKDLTIVALDGNRVAVRKSTLDFEGDSFSVVVPAKTLNEIVKILQPVNDDIGIFCSKNQILFEAENFRVVSKLIEGEYFKYRYLLGKEYGTKITVNTRKLLQSVERAYLISSDDRDKTYPVRLAITNQKMVVAANTPTGALRDEIEIESAGSAMNISYNPRYLLEALRVIDDENVGIEFVSNPGPCSILPLNGDSFVYIIMSLRG